MSAILFCFLRWFPQEKNRIAHCLFVCSKLACKHNSVNLLFAAQKSFPFENVFSVVELLYMCHAGYEYDSFKRSSCSLVRAIKFLYFGQHILHHKNTLAGKQLWTDECFCLCVWTWSVICLDKHLPSDFSLDGVFSSTNNYEPSDFAFPYGKWNKARNNE